MLTVCVFIIQLCGLYITKQQYLDLYVACYNKCLKRFFGIPKYSSMTTALLETAGLPSCDTILLNCNTRFCASLSSSTNYLVQMLQSIQ